MLRKSFVLYSWKSFFLSLSMTIPIIRGQFISAVPSAPIRRAISYLHSEEDQEGYHEREQSSGFSESETQNGVGEQLSTEGWVSRNTGDQGSEDRTDTSSSSLSYWLAL